MVVVSSDSLALGREPVKALLWKFALPAIVGMLVNSLYNIIDRVFIGQGVGALAISGLALTLPVMTLVVAIGTLVGVGGSARMSIVLGKRDIHWAQQILATVVILTFVLSILFVTLTMIYLDDLLILFGGSEATIGYAKDFLRIVIPGSVFSNLTYSLSALIRATGNPKKSMYVILVGVVFNIILDPIFIFWMDLGIKGAAWATVISMFLGACVALYYFLNKSREVHFTRKQFMIKGYIVKNILGIGLAPFLMNLIASGVSLVANQLLVRHGGDLAIGAFGIMNSLAMLIVMAMMGLCQGMQPIVGYNYGAKKLKRLKDTLLITGRWSFLVGCFGLLMSLVMPETMARAFTNDPVLLKLSTQSIRICLALLPLVGIQIVISNYFMSISKPGQSIFMTLSRQLLFLVPMMIFFANKWGMTGIWLSIPASDALAFLAAIILIRIEKKKLYRRNLTEPVSQW